MDYTTYRQTVCTHNSGDFTMNTIEARPVCPESLSPPEYMADIPRERLSYYITNNSTSIRWFLDGTIKLYDETGNLFKTWYPRPTLQELIDTPNGSMCVAFRNGEIFMKTEGYSYYWGASFLGVP